MLPEVPLKGPKQELRDELDQIAGRLRRTAVCERPDCTRRCRARVGARGRLPKFCSTRCRMKCHEERESIEASLRRIEWACDRYTATSNPLGGSLAKRAAEVRRVLIWSLDRYPVPDRIALDKQSQAAPKPLQRYEPIAPIIAVAKRMSGEDLTPAEMEELEGYYAKLRALALPPRKRARRARRRPTSRRPEQRPESTPSSSLPPAVTSR